MQRQSTVNGRPRWRWAIGLLLVLGSLGLASAPQRPVRAQAGADPTPPPRTQSSGPAPDREPVVLETRTLADLTTATVVEVPASADAYIASGRPDQNFGAGALFLGYNLQDAFNAERILLRFDLSSIPANVIVHDARLRLYLIQGSPAGDAPMGTVVRRLASSWAETAVTWNTEPAWASVRDESAVGVTAGWYEWNITDLATAWVQSAIANHGVEVQGDENVQQRERAFYSRETTTGFFPRLVIDYTVVNDTQPPQITVSPLPPFSQRGFTVAWTGTDQGPAGLSHYDVQYQLDGGPWLDWLVGVTFTSAEFVGVTGHTYAFRARGVDKVGNVEPYGAAEAQTLIDTVPPQATMSALPNRVTAAPFTVSWSGTDVGSGIHHYDVRYRFNGGAWIAWQNQTLATSAQFAAMVDGLYEFEARAVDNAGHVQPFTNVPQAATVRDVVAPFITPQWWLPVMAR